MPGCSSRGLLRIRPFVHPPVLAKPVKSSGAGRKLPKAFALRTGISQWFEGTLGLAEIDQVLRQTLLGQDSGNHGSIPPGALHANFKTLAATLLKIVQIAQHKVVDWQGNIVRRFLNGLFGHLFRLWVEGQRDFAGSDFIQRSLFYLFFVKAVPCLQSGQFVVVNAVEQAFIMAFEPFVLANHRTRAQQDIQRLVEVLLGLCPGTRL